MDGYVDGQVSLFFVGHGKEDSARYLWHGKSGARGMGQDKRQRTQGHGGKDPPSSEKPV